MLQVLGQRQHGSIREDGVAFIAGPVGNTKIAEGTMKKRMVFLTAMALLVTMGLVGLSHGAEMCTTIDQTLGFATYRALDAFLAAARSAATDQSKRAGLKSLVKALIEKKEAFPLRGGQKVEPLEEQPGDDPSMTKVRVRAEKDKRVFWVPAGALNCK
jgi:hypothetical protein